MSEFRKDPISGRWVILSSVRSKRPSDFKDPSQPPTRPQGAGPCAFCKHHEHETGAELFAFRAGTTVSAPDWRVRVVKNIYPAVFPEAELGTVSAHGGSVTRSLPGFGSHEVVIETPDHDTKLTDLPFDHVKEVLMAFRHRIRCLRDDGRFKYVQVFKNKGKAAGASLQHSHSQIIGLPIIPHHVQLEIDGSISHFNKTRRCVFCDILEQELKDGSRVIDCSSEYIVLAPYAPKYPYETWILPRIHASNFEDASDLELQKLASVLASTLRKLEALLDDAPYNYMLHTSPVQDYCQVPYYHWSIRIVPHLLTLGGFELGSGCHIIPVFPEKATAELRDVNLSSL